MQTEFTSPCLLLINSDIRNTKPELSRDISEKKLVFSNMGFMRILGVFLGLVAVGLSLFSLMSPKWAVNVKNAGGIQAMQDVAVGLWKYCVKNGQTSNVSFRINKYYTLTDTGENVQKWTRVFSTRR